MKRMFKLISAAALAFSAILPLNLFSQQLPELPIDPEVRKGQLENGLTYYIRHNELPKGQADFYIAQNVGSALEEDNQRGLAHFLEHMCFNGTTHFPGNSLISWLETVGVKFGANLNAYTSIDETVYNISSVPVARESVQDSCLLILHDWANDLLLEPEEIDKERGVIHQEWRSRNHGQNRILEQILPDLYPDSRYGYRMPIGTMEIVDNFPYQDLRDYYEKWYRPDQQAIIVVGDIDVDRIENSIKKIFSDIPAQPDAAPRVYYPVPDNEGTLIAIGHDKEMPQNMAQLMFKSDPMPDMYRNTPMAYAQNYIEYAISHMLNQRLQDIASKPESPFAGAQISFGDYVVSRTKDAMSVTAVTNDTESLTAGLAAAYRELLRAARGGFTVSEYERAQNEYKSRLEKSYEGRDKRLNGQFSREYVRNFTRKEAIPGIETDYQLGTALATQIPLEQINQIIAQSVTPDNRALLVMMPDNEAGVYPTGDDFLGALAAVDAEEIEAYKDEMKSEPLIPSLPAPGKIVKEETNSTWDATLWTLSNGAKVWVKKTDLNNSEIFFSAISNGTGVAQFPDSYAADIQFMPVAIQDYALGDYTHSDIKKYLQGKQISFSIDPGTYYFDMSGSSTPKDITTLMEFIYMTCTGFELDADEFAANQTTYESLIKNQENTPNYVFGKHVMGLASSPKEQVLTSEAVKNARRDVIVDMIKKMTSNAAEFTFAFVGNIDIDQMRTLVEQYIATIPGNPATAKHKIDYSDKSLQTKGGKGIDTYTTEMATPQTLVYLKLWTKLPYTAKNQKVASVAGQVLSKRLLNIVREDMGAVYSIGAQGSMSRIDPQNANLASSFPMKPEMKEEVLKVIDEQINDMTKNVTDDEIAPIKEYMVKSIAEAKEQNSGWGGSLLGWARNGVDTLNGSEEVINSITTKDVQDFMKSLLKSGNYRYVILDPKN